MIGLRGGLDKVEKGLNGIRKSMSEMNQKLDKEISIREILEKEIKDLKQRVSILQERIDDMEKRLKTLS